MTAIGHTAEQRNGIPTASWRLSPTDTLHALALFLVSLSVLAGKGDLARLLPWQPLEYLSFRAVFLAPAFFCAALLFVFERRRMSSVGYGALLAIAGPLIAMFLFNMFGHWQIWENSAWHVNDTDLLVVLLTVGLVGYLVSGRKDLHLLVLQFCVAVLAIDVVNLIARFAAEPIFTSITASRINSVAFFCALFLMLTATRTRWQVLWFLAAELFLFFAAISGSKAGIVVLGSASLIAGAYLVVVGRYRFTFAVALTFLLPLSGLFVSDVSTEIRGRFANAMQLEFNVAAGDECSTKDSYAIVHSKRVCMSVNDTTERIRLWSHAFSLIIERPVLGGGPDVYSFPITTEYASNMIYEEVTYTYTYPHNLLLEVAVSSGLVGLILLAVALFACVVVYGRATHANPAYAMLFSVFMAMFLASMFGGDLYDIRYVWIFAMAIAAAGMASPPRSADLNSPD